MSWRNDHPSLFDRLRRAPALRILLVVATLFASQTSLACAFEDVVAPQGIEVSAIDEPGEDCCTFCIDCANCGGCHSSAVSPRGNFAQFSFAAVAFTKLTSATVAPKLWTPPALLRPPIDAA